MSNEVGRILIIDDLSRNIQVVANILREDDYIVAYARNGADGISLLRESIFDLVLLDIMMPEMDGYEVCRRIKEDPEIAPVPVIFITAKNEAADILKGLRLGAVDYISKPFNPAELLYRVKTHIELKQNRDRLQELNLMKDRFASIMAHDIKGSFHAILGLTEVLRSRYDTSSEECRREYIENIFNSSHHLYSLLENILEWSKLQMGHVSVFPQKLNVKKITDESLAIFSDDAVSKNIIFETDIGSSAVVYADENMVRSILRNLISNAVKFSFSGEKVTVAAEEESGMLRIDVIDSGVGIEPEIKSKLFQFRQSASRTGTADERGTGMGLVLTRDLVEINSGKLEISDNPEGGTIASVSIPIEKQR